MTMDNTCQIAESMWRVVSVVWRNLEVSTRTQPLDNVGRHLMYRIAE